MTAEEIREVAKNYRGVEVRRTRTSNLGDLAAFKGETRISMRFSQEGLEKIGLSWTEGLTSARYEPLHNLCTGEKSVLAVIHAPPELGGALIYLDDVKVAELPSTGSIVLDVPVGHHTFHFEKVGYQPWKGSVNYSAEGPGYVHLSVSGLVPL